MSDWQGTLTLESIADGKAVFRYDVVPSLSPEVKYAAGFTKIPDGAPVDDERKAVRRNERGPSNVAEMLCKTADFQIWVAEESTRKFGGVHEPSESLARRFITMACGISAFEQLDMDENARISFTARVETPYYRYVTMEKKK